MFINLLLVSMCLCLTAAVSLKRRAIPPTDDASNVINQLKYFYESAYYSMSCFGTDCPEAQSKAQYCSNTCKGNATGTSILLNSSDVCISKEACGVKTSINLNPFNISINSGSCYLSATAPKLQVVPKGTVVLANVQFNYKVSLKMDFVWSGLNLECINLPSVNGPSSSTSSCYQELTKYLSFLCPIKNILPFFGFYFLYWLPCQSNSTSSSTSNPSSTVNSFSGPLQFTQSITTVRLYTFAPPSSGSLSVATSPASDATTRTYSFVFDAGVPVGNQPAIQAGIENVFNNGDKTEVEATVTQIFYNNALSAFVSIFCSDPDLCK